jgi:hypothetical protein
VSAGLLQHVFIFFERSVDTGSLCSSAFTAIIIPAGRLIPGAPSIKDMYDMPPEGFLVASPKTEDEEEDWEAPDTLRDEEFTRKLFGDLNRGLLGSPGDGKVIIISDFKEEEQQDDCANTEATPSSLRVPPAPPASTTEDDGTPDWVQDDSSGDRSEDEAGIR